MLGAYLAHCSWGLRLSLPYRPWGAGQVAWNPHDPALLFTERRFLCG